MHRTGEGRRGVLAIDCAAVRLSLFCDRSSDVLCGYSPVVWEVGGWHSMTGKWSFVSRDNRLDKAIFRTGSMMGIGLRFAV